MGKRLPFCLRIFRITEIFGKLEAGYGSSTPLMVAVLRTRNVKRLQANFFKSPLRMNTSPITITDIAKALGMSSSTVSRALKGSYKISEATIQKVKDYAEAHHYKPNLLAQSLKNKQSRNIGVILCSIPNSFFSEVINGIESVAADKDYFVFISQSHESLQKEKKNLEHLAWRSVDGLLVSLSSETADISHFEAIQSKGVPVVFFDRIPNTIHTHKVISDNVDGAFRLTNHLLEAGFRRIAHVTSPPDISITQDRLEGYKQALLQAGLPVRDAYIKYCMHGGMELCEIETVLDELFALDDPPDAIFAASDRLTIGCFSLIKKRGLSIPQDVSISGFSNFSAPGLFSPSLTTVTQRAFDMGRKATELLLQLIESKRPVKKFEKIVLPTELCVRDSTQKI